MERINIEENIENHIIDLITEDSENRLIVFKPKENSEVVDLVVKQRGDYKGKEISLYINTFIGPSTTSNIVKDIFKEKFIFNKDLYLMFVYFDGIKQEIKNVWLIPFPEFLEIADSKKLEDNKTVLRFETIIDMDKKDKYTKFLISKKELGKFLLEIIKIKEELILK